MIFIILRILLPRDIVVFREMHRFLIERNAKELCLSLGHTPRKRKPQGRVWRNIRPIPLPLVMVE